MITQPEGARSTDPLAASVDRAFRLPWPAAVLSSLGLLGVLLLSATTGAADLPVDGVLRAIVDRLPGIDIESGLDTTEQALLFSIRLPRAILGALVGAALGMAGAAYQGVFQNPLADPYLLGVSAGAGLGAVLTLGFGFDIGWGPFHSLPMAAFVGALGAVSGSALIARGSFAHPATLLLSGVAIAALLSAVQTYALQKLDANRAREVLSWLFGKLATDGWNPVQLLFPYVVLGLVVLTLSARHLDVLRVGDDEAKALGLAPARSRLLIVLTATLVTAAAVAVSGLIAFAGLVVPHLVRLLVSHSYRVIVPLSAVLGAAFLAGVDIGARTIVAPAELPVGVISSIVGAPFFAMVLWRRVRTGQ